MRKLTFLFSLLAGLVAALLLTEPAHGQSAVIGAERAIIDYRERVAARQEAADRDRYIRATVEDGVCAPMMKQHTMTYREFMNQYGFTKSEFNFVQNVCIELEMLAVNPPLRKDLKEKYK